MDDKHIYDIEKLIMYVKSKDESTFDVSISVILKDIDAIHTNDFQIGKVAMSSEEALESFFEAAKMAMRDLLDGNVVLAEQAYV